MTRVHLRGWFLSLREIQSLEKPKAFSNGCHSHPAKSSAPFHLKLKSFLIYFLLKLHP